MVKRNELIKFIYKTIGKDLLLKARIMDEAANGVQILGKEKVAKVALGTSLNQEFLQKAASWGADVCIFHHGFDPRAFKSRFSLASQKRLRIIFRNDLTIMGFHFCLDSHAQIGNNATIIRKLGAKITDSFWQEWGYVASFAQPQDLNKLKEKCEQIFNHKVFAVLANKHKVKTIGVASGAAKPGAEQLLEMQEKGVELFISGEPAESAPHSLVESGISYFVGGHYNTEGFGVKALGEKIKSRFGNKIKVEFIDIPNEI